MRDAQDSDATMNKDDDDDVEEVGPAKQLTKEEASMQSVVGDGAKAVTLQADTKGFAFLEAAVRKRKTEQLEQRRAAETVAVVCVRVRVCVCVRPCATSLRVTSVARTIARRRCGHRGA